MKRMVLWFSGLLAVVFLMVLYLLLTFNLPTDGESPSTENTGVVEITFWDINWDRNDHIQHMRNLVGDFNRQNPHIRVIYESKPFEYYYQIFSSSIASGDNPDICVIPSAMAVQLARLGFLMQVDGTYQLISGPENRDDFIADSLAQLTVDGYLIGIPQSVDQFVLYTRSDLLEARGLAPPDSLSDFETIASALRSDNVCTLAFPCAAASGSRSLSHLIIQGGGTVSGADGGLSISDPNNMAVFSMLNALYNMRSLPLGQESLDEDEVLRLFINDEAISILARPSAYNRMLKQRPELSSHIKAVPTLEGYSGTNNSGSLFINAMCVFENTENPDAVLEFAGWWQTNSSVIWYKDALTVSPARRSTLNNLAQDDCGFSNVYSTQIASRALPPTYPLVNSPLFIAMEAKNLLKDVLYQCFTREGVTPEWASEYDLYLNEWSRVFQQ